MNCKETKNNLAEYASGMEDKTLASDVAAHLQSCKECEKEYSEILTVLEAAVSLKAEDPGAAFWAGYLPALRKKMEKKIGFFEFLSSPVPVVALSLIALALLVSPILLTTGIHKKGKVVSAEQAALLLEIEQHYDEYAAILYDDETLKSIR